MKTKRRLMEGLMLAGIGIAALLLTSCEPQTVAAPQAVSDCLVEGMSLGRVEKDPVMTKYCRDRVSQGWKLVGVGMGGFVWVK